MLFHIICEISLLHLIIYIASSDIGLTYRQYRLLISCKYIYIYTKYI